MWIGGYGVAKGYVNQEKLTNEKFNEILGVRWYKTGDKAQYFSDGNIQFLGRLDDQVKVNGYRIELGEIENIIKKESYIDDAVAMIAEHNGKREIIAAVLPQFYKENTEFEMITNEENPEYLQMQKDRIIAVAGFILEVQGAPDISPPWWVVLILWPAAVICLAFFWLTLRGLPGMYSLFMSFL